MLNALTIVTKKKKKCQIQNLNLQNSWIEYGTQLPLGFTYNIQDRGFNHTSIVTYFIVHVSIQFIPDQEILEDSMYDYVGIIKLRKMRSMVMPSVRQRYLYLGKFS